MSALIPVFSLALMMLFASLSPDKKAAFLALENLLADTTTKGHDECFKVLSERASK